MKYFILLLCTIPAVLQAQVLNVKSMEVNVDNLVIYYSLSDTVAGRDYTINLYASRDNYVNPLTQLSGDYGLAIKPGNDKKLIWNAKKELGEDFEGTVAVEVRARVYVPFILFDSFDKIKRGKHKEVTWRGGTKQNILNFELYNSKGKQVAVIPNVSNSGHTRLYIPTDVKTGKDYRFRIVDSKNKDQIVYTETFSVKRKVPLVLLVAGVAAVGGGVVLLGGGESGGGSGTKEIGGPPNPPGD